MFSKLNACIVTPERVFPISRKGGSEGGRGERGREGERERGGSGDREMRRRVIGDAYFLSIRIQMHPTSRQRDENAILVLSFC